MRSLRDKSRMRRWLLIILALYPAWLLLECLHEFGHVLHAWISGASVLYVDLPLLGFSRTEVVENVHPQFVAWGGPIWGSLLPLLAQMMTPRKWSTARRLLQAFVGLCLIANGAYLS